MSAAPISREVALRIGLAARALPDTEPKRLVAVLIEQIGHPLTEAKLEKLKLKDLKQAAEGEFQDLPQEALKAALECLQGQHGTDSDTSLPAVQPYQDGDMPESIRVACASNNSNVLDGHFGSCARFLIYQVSKDETRLVAIRSTQGDKEADDKNAFRAELINDCHVLYIMSIGGPAAAKVVKNGLHPIKQPQGGDATEIIDNLKQVLNSSPPPWLAKVMGVSAENRARFSMEEDAS
ncbi:nitrogen fixation protein NifX [Candidatus Albibeggiatoa sp. nov. BB20]|uniref:nitrogen fixation protein NifX n=1 Tax=Candidatus Albibeggiatoa sp. nov. BB20 TaxID=3162723 RepID=UPI0033656AF3